MASDKDRRESAQAEQQYRLSKATTFHEVPP
jgi:hypothetical protein